MKSSIRQKIYDTRLASIRALWKHRNKRPKLPKHAPALLILKRGSDYFSVDYTRYRDLFVCCPCGDLIKPIPGATCITCGAEVERIVDDAALREMAERCRRENQASFPPATAPPLSRSGNRADVAVHNQPRPFALHGGI